MSTTKNLKPRSRVEVKVNFPPKQDIVWYLYWILLKLYKCHNTLHRPTFILFPPISMTLLERCTGPTPEHPSNTTIVPQVSNATGTPLDSILFHRFEACSHKPPFQAPGLGSFIANFIAQQVYVRNRLVDFQCFGKGLWTKTMSN